MRAMKKLGFWLVIITIGIANAVILWAFEFIGIEGTEWLWNDILHADNSAIRWLIVPLAAVVLSISLSALTIVLSEKRLVPIHDLTDEIEHPEGKATLSALGIILIIGAVSLLAGASLGPEASLMAASITLALWATARFEFTGAQKILILSSISALFVAFFGSLIVVFVPLLLLIKQKRFKLVPVTSVLLASIVSFIVILLIDGDSPGYGVFPHLPNLQPHDYWMAIVIGFATSIIALALNWCIKGFSRLAILIDKQLNWVLSAGLFGLVLGVLYLIGGETIQFSGSVGTSLLVQNALSYSAFALIAMIITKILATSWSKATGYRGGLVFPSIYIGVALGILVTVLLPEFGGTGAVIGSVAGILSASLGSPIIAGILLLAIVPPSEALLIAACAIAGTMIFNYGALLVKKQAARYAK